MEKSGQELVNEKIRLQQEVEILSGKLAKRQSRRKVDSVN
ncbi:UNVERIFIED_CONTAM: hypothetical protein ABIC26_003271 [Paenibacillus sp. PvR008]